MGRRRTRLHISRSDKTDLQRCLRKSTHPRDQERLKTVLLASTGQYTLVELAKRLGRARSTVQLWLDKFARGGIEALLKRDTPPGSSSPLATRSIQSQLRAGLRCARWRSAEEIASWLADDSRNPSLTKIHLLLDQKTGILSPWLEVSGTNPALNVHRGKFTR